jgi:hypothetical protein
MNYYRYEYKENRVKDENGEMENANSAWDNDYGPGLELHILPVVRHTPCGVYVKHAWTDDYITHKPKLVIHSHKKKYAYPTKEQALTNFVLRTERRIEILKRQIKQAEEAFKVGLKMLNKVESKQNEQNDGDTDLSAVLPWTVGGCHPATILERDKKQHGGEDPDW